MKNLRRTAVLLALFGVIFLTFAFIYPTTPGQRLYDSTNYHYMASLVSRDGTARWNLGFLSLYEMYPIVAGNMGQVYFLSGISQMTRVHIQPSILLMNFGWIVFLCLSSFLLGRKIFSNNNAGLLTAFFFMSARVISSYVNWTATSRGFACAVLPFLFLLMIKSYEFDRKPVFRPKYFMLFLIFLILTPTFHKLLYLFFPVIISYFFFVKTYPLLKRKNNELFARIKIFHKKFYSSTRIIIYISMIVFPLLFSIQFATTFFGYAPFLTESAILSGENLIIQVINYFYYMARAFGIAAAFSLIGILFIAKGQKSSLEIFLFVGVCFFIPLSIRGSYSSPIWILFLSLFAAIGFVKIGNILLKGSRKIDVKVLVVVLLLLLPIYAPPFITIVEPYQPERVRPQYVTDVEMETGHYLKYNLRENQTFFADPTFNSHIFTGLSGREGLGLIGVEFATVNSSLRDDLTVEQLIEYEGLTSIFEFAENVHTNKGQFFEISEDPLFDDHGFARSRHILWFRQFFLRSRYDTIVSAYNITTIIIDESFVRDHGYITVLDSTEYVTYRNSRYSFYNAPKT